MIFDDRWHYPRTDFSHSVHEALQTDQVKGIRLFGPRRTGKTQFILRDLTRRADQYGNRFAYVSFWQTPDPFELLQYELEQARIPDGSLARAAHWFSKSKKEVQVGVAAGPATASATLTGAPDTVFGEQELRIAKLLDELKNNAKPLLLFFDEFQALAAHPAGPQILTSLYRLLEARQTGVKAVFSGSSQIELVRVFSEQGNTPFGGFGVPLPLPDLTEDFVDFQCKVFEQTYKRALPKDAALDVFNSFDRNPEIFRSWVVQTGIMREARPDEVIAHIFDDFDAQFGFTIAFEQKNANRAETRLRRQVFLRMLAEGTHQPTGKAGVERFAEITQGPEPKKSQLKSVLTDMKKVGLVDQEDGKNVVSDPIFARWILRLPIETFHSKNMKQVN